MKKLAWAALCIGVWLSPQVATAQAGRTAAKAATVVLPNRIDAYDAVVREDRLYVLTPDQRALVAYALPSLAMAWRRELPGAGPQGSQLSALEPDRLLVWNAGRIYVVSRDSGALVAQHTDAVTGARPFLWRNGDACGLNRECSFQPIDCRTAKALGPPVHGERVHFHEHGDTRGPSCFSFDHAPIGATPAVAVYVFKGAEGHHDAEVVALDRATGAVRYRKPALACRSCERNALGAVPRIGLCLTTSSDDGALATQAFDCETGAARWTYKAQVPSNPQATMSYVDGTQPAVLLSLPEAAVLIDAATGKPRFTVKLSRGTLATIAGARSDASLLSIDQFTALSTLDAATGAVVKKEAVPSGGHVTLARDGTIRVISHELPGETSGQHAPLPATAAIFSVERGPGKTPAKVRLRATSQVVLPLAHDASWLGEVADGDGVLAAIFANGDDAPGQVRFVRAAQTVRAR